MLHGGVTADVDDSVWVAALEAGAMTVTVMSGAVTQNTVSEVVMEDPTVILLGEQVVADVGDTVVDQDVFAATLGHTKLILC